MWPGGSNPDQILIPMIHAHQALGSQAWCVGLIQDLTEAFATKWQGSSVKTDSAAGQVDTRDARH